MKKLFFVLVAATSLFAACTVKLDSAIDNEPDNEPSEVRFGAYLNRGVASKAGMTGELNTDGLKAPGQGFGVFAYYTADNFYNDGARPDFMYNQQVTYDATSGQWVYVPVKYWPNEFGAAAVSEDIDRVTFFAYAPYVQVTPTNGVVTGDDTVGIIGLSRNSAIGDPLVKYVVSMDPGSGVDLCWGVSKSGLTDAAGGTNNIPAGSPYIDLLKPKTGTLIDFEFQHALAALDIKIDAAVDAVAPGKDVDANTRIFVRSVSFEGFTGKGALSLNSTKANGPVWTDLTGSGRLSNDPMVVYDGRLDGKEGVESAAAKTEKPTGLNPVLVQAVPYNNTALKAGVTKTSVSLFKPSLTDASTSIFVIPTGEPLKITIVYDVETQDDNLATLLSDGETHGSTVENAITQTVQVSAGDLVLEAGKKYTISMHLGMTSVKFDASVSTWTDGGTGTGNFPANVD